MAGSPKDDKRAEDDPEFKRVVGNLLKTPPTLHKDVPPKRQKDQPKDKD